jgi:hypothetical protein
MTTTAFIGTGFAMRDQRHIRLAAGTIKAGVEGEAQLLK